MIGRVRAACPAGLTSLVQVAQCGSPPSAAFGPVYPINKTKPEIVTNVPELGGKALKIPFAPGDSFGGRAGAHSNWKRFALFRFDAVNPSKNAVKLELTVVHARSTSYQTRVVMPSSRTPR